MDAPQVYALVDKYGGSSGGSVERTGLSVAEQAIQRAVALASRAELQYKDLFGYTILMRASYRKCSRRVFETLLAHPCLRSTHMLEATTKWGETALFWAAVYAHAPGVEALAEAGARVNVCNHMGDTPLHKAALLGHVATVQSLLRAGADPHIPNHKGLTANQCAVAVGALDCVELMNASANHQVALARHLLSLSRLRQGPLAQHELFSRRAFAPLVREIVEYCSADVDVENDFMRYNEPAPHACCHIS